MKVSFNCPCCSQGMFSECCQPFLTDDKVPEYPEQLMRSRYSAYCRKNLKYVLKTWHSSTRPEIKKLDAGRWISLKILHSKVIENNAEGEVKFIAKHLHKNKLTTLIELSTFRKENGAWQYVSGEIDAMSFSDQDIALNSQCPCESGKRFLKCHFEQ